MQDHKLAVLIDADNVPSGHVKEMLEEISKSGTPTVKRIYGDWTQARLGGWKKVLLDNAITPVQQYSYTTGKNSSDSALIIDAMDILYAAQVTGFCIVSSDSDFTRLATRLREAGMLVIGIGERKTPQPFIAACNKFIYLEILKKAGKGAPVEEKSKDKASETDSEALINLEVHEKEISKGVEKVDKKIVELLVNSVDDLEDDTGWALLSSLGNMLSKKKPDFDPRNYGFKKLLDLVKHVNRFEIEERETSSNRNSKHIFLRIK